MTKKEVIVNHPMELSLPSKEAKALRKILKEANQSYVLECEETKDVKVGKLQYYSFKIHCPTTTFANAYLHFGILYAQYVLPIWKKRYNKQK
jgi:hypothetical protein